MSAMGDTTTDWQAEVLRLKHGPRQMPTATIAEVVGKHAATVRKVVARATDEDVEKALAAEVFNAEGARIAPGQTTVDEYLTGVEPDPADDPEYTPTDPLDSFRQEAGEAVGPMPPAPSPPEPLGVEVRLAGTRQMALDFGENASLPTGATIVLKSEKRASGFYGLGDVFSGTFTARVTKAPGEEAFDKDMGEYMAKDIAYVATITEFTVKPEEN